MSFVDVLFEYEDNVCVMIIGCFGKGYYDDFKVLGLYIEMLIC